MNEEVPYNPPGRDEYTRECARKNQRLLEKWKKEDADRFQYLQGFDVKITIEGGGKKETISALRGHLREAIDAAMNASSDDCPPALAGARCYEIRRVADNLRLKNL